jgi:ABC-type nickel/cobalt efflux system permease component RcnA
MVAMVEIAFLILVALLGLWWLSRTSMFRALRRSGADPTLDHDRSGSVKGRRFRRSGGISTDFDSASAGFRMRPPSVRHHDDK